MDHTLRQRVLRGFTLIELVVVMAIIVLVLAILLPAINNLTGSRSLENAQNQIGAYLSAARNDAIHYQVPTGVCFYIDATSRQFSLVEVQEINFSIYANESSNDGNPNGTLAWDQFSSNIPLDIAGTRTVISPTMGYVTPYRGTLVLPKNIGVALYTYPVTTSAWVQDAYPSAGTSQGTYIVHVDQLMRMGMIMFDQYGAITFVQWGIPAYGTTALGSGSVQTVPIPNSLSPRLLAPTPAAPAGGYNFGGGGGPNTYQGNDGYAWSARSTDGFYLYDRNQFLGNTFPDTHQPFGEADLLFQPPWLPYANSSSPPAPSYTDKQIEENWIFANGISLTVNPFDGTLMKGK